MQEHKKEESAPVVTPFASSNVIPNGVFPPPSAAGFTAQRLSSTLLLMLSRTQAGVRRRTLKGVEREVKFPLRRVSQALSMKSCSAVLAAELLAFRLVVDDFDSNPQIASWIVKRVRTEAQRLSPTEEACKGAQRYVLRNFSKLFPSKFK